MRFRKNQAKTFRWAGEDITAHYLEKVEYDNTIYYVFVDDRGIKYPLTEIVLKGDGKVKKKRKRNTAK